MIALSLALAPTMEKVGRYWLIPQDRHSVILQGYGITKVGKDLQGVWRFYQFLETPKARSIFAKYGFVWPRELR